MTGHPRRTRPGGGSFRSIAEAPTAGRDGGGIAPAAAALLLLLLISWGVPADGGAGATVTDVTPAQARELIRANRSVPGFVILDVRTPAEYREERLDEAVLLDASAPDFRAKLARLDRKGTYLVYCRTANRSRGAVDLMRELEFGKVYHMTGGILKWKGEGFPTVR